jgi:uncharacterized membrane protein YhaH (DUF805 family)
MAKFCAECGDSVISTDLYCSECGNKLNHSHDKHQSNINKQQKLNPKSENKAQKIVGLNRAVILSFRNFTNFKTRSSRSEYWFFVLFQVIIYSVFSLIFLVIEAAYSSSGYTLQTRDVLAMIVFILMGVFWVAMLLPTLSLMVRRLHDSGSSAWYLLLSLIPYLGGLIMLIFFSSKSESRENKYGEIPNTIKE